MTLKRPYELSFKEHFQIQMWSWWFFVVDKLPASIRKRLPEKLY